MPAGDDVITFSYHSPPHLLAATFLSVGAVIGLVALALVAAVRSRRRGISRTDAPA